jgi:hypothetical protein
MGFELSHSLFCNKFGRLVGAKRLELNSITGCSANCSREQGNEVGIVMTIERGDVAHRLHEAKFLRAVGCIIRCGFDSAPIRIGEHDLSS